MKSKLFLIISLLLVMMAALSACGRILTPEPDNGSKGITEQTAVMQTVSAVLTQQAFETLIAQATSFAATPTALATDEPTVAPTSLPTALPTAANTQVAPTQTQPIPTSLPPTATPKPIPCNAAEFVKDVTIPDGTEMVGWQKFTKTWRLKNVGTCTWTKTYEVFFYDGDAMSAPAAVALGKSVAPGESIDVSVAMVAPNKKDSYKGYWMLRDEADKRFGIGSNAMQSFWVSIKVVQVTTTDIPTAIYPLDFVASLCSAGWYSNAGDVSRACPNISLGEAQWVDITFKPVFEGGIKEDERSLLMHLDKPGNWMVGVYPAFKVENGDHFVAWLGCSYSNTQCDVVISLDYRIGDGDQINLGKWIETLDGKITKVDLDVSKLEGKNVTFILGVTNKNVSGPVEVIWLTPSIQR